MPRPPDIPEHIAQQKANFLATISHELRTPMQSIYALLELIEQENTDPHIQGMVNAAQGSANLMLDLLNDILDFARLDAGRFELEQLEVPVRTLVQGIIEALAPQAEKKSLELSICIDSDVPTLIIGDPKRLRQILFNLVSNAIKFTQAGSVTIRVSLAAASFPDQHLLHFEVTDTGIGISPEIQKKLFRPFTQADHSTARQYGGTGLGLSICHRLVNLMGGDIGVISTESQGSTFWFDIPCTSYQYLYTDETIDLSGLSVLVLDHHPAGAAEIERSLRQMGADVIIARETNEIPSFLEKQRFDVAILDCIPPLDTAFDMIKTCSLRFPRMAMIAYTFHTADGLKTQLDYYGVTYLPRPASRKGLGQTVLDVTKKKWNERAPLPKRVLVAEDTESIRETLRLQFKRMGIEADFVTNGIDALRELTGCGYGLLLLDLHMHGMDGYGVIKELRSPGHPCHDLPVILMTADVQMAGRTAYSPHGFDDCLIKPATFNHLKHTLERWGIPIHETREKDQGATPPISFSPGMIETGTPFPLINIDRLMADMGGSYEDAVKVLQSFPTLCAPVIKHLVEASSYGHVVQIAEAAHSMKGAARFACCDSLADLAAAIQTHGESGENPKALVKKMQILFDDIAKEIKRDYGQAGAPAP